MSRQINLRMDDDDRRLLEKIPGEERSRLINEALRAWAKRRRRREAAAEMDASRAQLPKTSNAGTIKWIRQDRERE